MTCNKKKFTDTSVIVLVAAVIVLVSMFLPYAVMRPAYRESFSVLEGCLEGTEIPYSSMTRVSVLEFVKIYIQTGKTNQEAAALGQFCGILSAVMGVTAILAGVFAVLKKPVPVLFFDLMTFAAFFIYNNNFANRELVPGPMYRFGIGYYLLYVAVVVSIAGGIWMLREKKAPQPEETEE